MLYILYLWNLSKFSSAYLNSNIQLNLMSLRWYAAFSRKWKIHYFTSLSGIQLESRAIICRYYNDLHVFDLDNYKVSTFHKIEFGYDKSSSSKISYLSMIHCISWYYIVGRNKTSTRSSLAKCKKRIPAFCFPRSCKYIHFLLLICYLFC